MGGGFTADQAAGVDTTTSNKCQYTSLDLIGPFLNDPQQIPVRIVYST